jgi:hypothetical protein
MGSGPALALEKGFLTERFGLADSCCFLQSLIGRVFFWMAQISFIKGLNSGQEKKS